VTLVVALPSCLLLGTGDGSGTSGKCEWKITRIFRVELLIILESVLTFVTLHIMLLSDLKDVLFGPFEAQLASDDTATSFATEIDALAKKIARNLDERYVSK
jgi:hypothetical protein